MKWVVLALVMLLVWSGAADRPSIAMPEYEINLDASPEERWTHVITERKAAINVTMTWLLGLIGPGTALNPVAEELRKAVLQGGGWSLDFQREMDGIAKALGMPSTYVQWANLFYEFGPFAMGEVKACTGIVVQLENGTMLHARNQDYGIPGLVDITVLVKFTRGGKVVYQGTTFATYAGMPTGMRNGAWSIEANTRFTGYSVNLVASLEAARKGGKTVGVFIRDTIERAGSYAEAIKAINSTLLIAPAYYTMVGTQPGEGAVVTRDRDGPADKESHGEGIWSVDSTHWFRVETNFDHWTPIQDGRRAAANKHMEKLGQAHADLQGLFGVLSTPPVLASDTVYTALMYPKEGQYHAFLRLNPSS